MHLAAPPARRDCDGARRCRVVSLCRHQRVWRLACAMTASWTFCALCCCLFCTDRSLRARPAQRLGLPFACGP